MKKECATGALNQSVWRLEQTPTETRVKNFKWEREQTTWPGESKWTRAQKTCALTLQP